MKNMRHYQKDTLKQGVVNNLGGGEATTFIGKLFIRDLQVRSYIGNLYMHYFYTWLNNSATTEVCII